MPKLPNREPGKPYTFEQVVKQLVNTPPKKEDKEKAAKKTKAARRRP